MYMLNNVNAAPVELVFDVDILFLNVVYALRPLI